MEPEERRRIGARIARARRESGLTQRELADRLGITARSVQSYEAGRIVPWRHLRRIEVLTHKRSGWLLQDEPGRDSAVSARTIDELLATIEEHQSLLREQLRLLRENTTQLTRRRADRTHDSVGHDAG
jgi:transcriptional regulator with XRE-family HTH domain